MPEDERRAVIFANGRIGDYDGIRALVRDDDWILCADGGARHALKLGLRPDVLLGDFDSLDPEVVQEVSRTGAEVVRVPAEKDQTDTHLVLDLAVSRGAREILVLGAAGDRLDHTIANILLLPRMAAMGVDVTIVDEKNIIRVTSGGISLEGRPGEFVSLIPLTPEVSGVTTSELKYPLHKGRLTWGESTGVSNEFTGDTAEVTIESGWLLVIQARD